MIYPFNLHCQCTQNKKSRVKINVAACKEKGKQETDDRFQKRRAAILRLLNRTANKKISGVNSARCISDPKGGQ